MTRQRALSPQSFVEGIRSSKNSQSIGVFVHGYNNTFQEALFRLAQIAADAGIATVPVLFSWPSRGSVTGYVADRESVLYSRDYLVALLVSLVEDAKPREIVLFGHSMGSFLIMEAVRQLRLEGRNDVVSRLKIVLAAPDIDADVFRAQLAVIGKLSPPLTLLVSADDRALAVSSLISAEDTRVGRLDINDPKITEAGLRYGVQVVDITSLGAGDALRHGRFANLAGLYPQLQSLDQSGSSSGAGRVGAFVFDAAGATISSPFRLASRIVAPQ